MSLEKWKNRRRFERASRWVNVTSIFMSPGVAGGERLISMGLLTVPAMRVVN